MKHYSIHLLVTIAALTLASCAGVQGPQGPMGPQGPKGENGSCNIMTRDLLVKSNEWQFTGNPNNPMPNDFYYVHFNIPELTQNIYDYGTITCYREYYHGTNQAYQISLPEEKHMYAVVSGNDYYYTQTIDYIFGKGYVEIGLTTSDFYYDIPEDMVFRVNIMW